MKFLNPGRAKPDGAKVLSKTIISVRKPRRKTTKAADTEAEISRYFTSAKATAQNSLNNQSNQNYETSGKKAHTPHSPASFIDLPEKPFLGFGSCGADSVSPVKRLDHRDKRNLAKSLTRSPTSSASYYTWSQSESHCQPSPVAAIRTVQPLKSPRHIRQCEKAYSPTEKDSRKAHSSPPCASQSRSARDKVSPDTITRSQTSARKPEKVVEPAERKDLSRDHSNPHGTRSALQFELCEAPLQLDGNLRTELQRESECSRRSQREPKQINHSEPSGRTTRGRKEEIGSNDNAPAEMTISIADVHTNQAAVASADDLLKDLLQECKFQDGVGITDSGKAYSGQHTTRTSGHSCTCEQIRPQQSLPQKAQYPDLGQKEDFTGNTINPVPDVRPVQQHHVDEYSQFQEHGLFDDTPSEANTLNRPTRPMNPPEHCQEHRKSRGDSRIAGNGYDTIYECQQDAHRYTLDNYDAGELIYDIRPRDSARRPHIDDKIFARPAQRSYNCSLNRGHDFGHDVQQQHSISEEFAYTNLIDTGTRHLGNEQLYEEIRPDNNGGDTFNYHDEPYEEFSLYNSAEMDDSYEGTTDQIYFGQEIDPYEIKRSILMEQDTNSVSTPRSGRIAVPLADQINSRRRMSAVHDRNDAPGMSGFWTPRMGY